MPRRPTPEPQRAVEQDWFSREPPESVPPPSTRPPPPPPTGSLVTAIGFGAIAGGVGSGAMLETARWVEHLQHVAPDGMVASRVEWLIAIGVLVGALIGWVLRHLLRVVPRVLFLALLLPNVWLVLQLFVLPRAAPWLALPTVPFALGVAAYGVCVGLARPLRAA